MEKQKGKNNHAKDNSKTIYRPSIRSGDLTETTKITDLWVKFLVCYIAFLRLIKRRIGRMAIPIAKDIPLNVGWITSFGRTPE